MLAQMAWQVLHLLAKLEKFQDAMLAQVESGILKLPGERVFRIGVLPSAYQAGKLVECFWIERKHFADFARRRFSTIGDDIGAHGSAQFSIALINILDSAFALIAAGQIEVNVRPFAALLGEETFEE